MKVTIELAGEPGHDVPAALLGENLEAGLGRVPALLSDRLRNPKFVGPADPQTGVAPCWEPGYNTMYYDAHYQVVRGVSLSGEESQLISYHGTKLNRGIVQAGLWLRAGETLEVELWARAQNQPAVLRVAIRPNSGARPAYAEARIEVATGYWENYRATLAAPQADPDAVFSVYVQGPGTVQLDQVHLRPADQPLLRQDVLAAVRELGVPVLRFPGGCESAAYRWQRGIGPPHLRPALPDPIFKEIASYDFGTDEFLALCHESGATPHITVAVGNGTPQEAADWAAYCANWYCQRGLALPRMYWHIGNEVYGRWELGAMTAHMYARTLRAFAPGIRAAYPNARLLAIGVAEGHNDVPGYTDWRRTVLAEAADCFDALAIQYYPGWTEALDPGEQNLFLYRAAHNTAEQVRRAIADCRAAGVDKGVAVTEWGLWIDAASHNRYREPSVTRHALYAAAVLQQFAALAPALELAEHYHFGPIGLVQVNGPRVELSCVGQLYRLFRRALPGRFVPLRIEAPALAEGIPAVDAICLRQPAAAWLLAVNRSPDAAAEVSVDDCGSVVEAATLAGKDAVSPMHALTPRNAANRVEIPPLSVTRIEFA